MRLVDSDAPLGTASLRALTPIDPQLVPDPRRWITLAVVGVSPVVVALDSTILNVAVPTMAADLSTSISTLEWVVTGFPLVVATFLMIGGRLGDLFGHRRAFLIGVALFGFGSLIALLSQSVPQVLFGQALVKGLGAALMMPASLAILSTTFTGRERATAFGMWGAATGASAALGPVVGGVLTSNASWRWSFGINVIVAPIAIVLALLFIPKLPRPAIRPKVDVLGASLVGVSCFGFVFAVSEGSEHGWFRPVRAFTWLWPADRPVSVSVAVLLLAGAAGLAFYVREQRLARDAADPLFDFDLLRTPSFRKGLIGCVCVSAAASVMSFVLPVFLQSGLHLSAQTNGLWQFPVGLSVLVGAQVGALLVGRIGLTRTVRSGLASLLLGLVAMRLVLDPSITQWRLLPACVLIGLGLGICSAQLTSLVLSEVDDRSTGVAGAATSAGRYVGVSLGVAISGSFMLGRLTGITERNIAGLQGLRPGIRADAIAGLHSDRTAFEVPVGANASERSLLDSAFVESISSSTYLALYIGMAVCVVAMMATSRLTSEVAAPRSSHQVEIPQ